MTSTVKGLWSEVLVGPRNGLDHECAISVDNTLTIPVTALGRTLGYLHDDQERALAEAVVRAFDLDLPLMS
ncbi:hypothetical protein [Ornithinimicrobium cavernae]|uniref:hypothetical protein n=1 Tax=Ornithinimicrobium cavernae TaxID=2666047 RepID=UPI0023514C46|nr:hypothetical protein [Ornithinimicrobium cavernae]